MSVGRLGHTQHQTTMRFSLLFCMVLVACAVSTQGSHEFPFNFGSPQFDSSAESKESNEESGESRENRIKSPSSYYAKDVIHGMGPQHSFLTIEFPKPQFPEPYKSDFQPHFPGPQVHQENQHSQFRKLFPEEPREPRAQVSVVKTDDGKKIMTMTKPGYKMVVEEMEGKPGEKTKMVGRTVKETKSSKDAGNNGETMHQSQSFQYQVVKSESSDDKRPQKTQHRSNDDLKGIDFSRFSQPKKSNFPTDFPAQYGFRQHQEFIKAQQHQNPFDFGKAFDGLQIPPGIRHIGF